MDELTVVTLIAKSLNVPEKRRMLLTDMRHLNANVFLLQETHFWENAFPILKNRFYLYHSTYSKAKSRGVSLLIAAKLPWSLTAVQTDPMGRFFLLKGLIGGVKVTIANL